MKTKVIASVALLGALAALTGCQSAPKQVYPPGTLLMSDGRPLPPYPYIEPLNEAWPVRSPERDNWFTRYYIVQQARKIWQREVMIAVRSLYPDRTYQWYDLVLASLAGGLSDYAAISAADNSIAIRVR